MKIFRNYLSKKAGLAPGSLVHVGARRMDRVQISAIAYDDEGVSERRLDSAEECEAFKRGKANAWINVDGLHDSKVIQTIGDSFGIHPLVLEDILNTGQRPKVENFDDYIFAVARMVSFEESKGEIESEQVSFLLGPRFLITFQERQGDVFEGVRERIRKTNFRIRRFGADYLLYALLDAIVDNYFIAMERISERIESLENEVMQRPTPASIRQIHGLKSELIQLRRSIWPLRDMARALAKEESKLIEERTEIFFRDLYDHTIQLTDAIDTFREMLSALMDVYLSSLSNRMNEVMKMLTVFAAIFIPLTFIAGIYGMNFEHMPELRWRPGYYVTLGVMLGVAVTMLAFFKRRGWIWSKG